MGLGFARVVARMKKVMSRKPRSTIGVMSTLGERDLRDLPEVGLKSAMLLIFFMSDNLDDLICLLGLLYRCGV